MTAALLLPYQARWYEDRSRRKLTVKSRRTGITWTTALEAVEVASTTRSGGGMHVFYMTQTREDARDFISDCAQWVKDLRPGMGQLVGTGDILETDWPDDDDALVYRMDFPSGFSIYGLSYNPHRLRGKQGFVIFDEAARLDLKECLRAAVALMMWGGRVAIISTYYGKNNEFYRQVHKNKDGTRSDSLHEISIYDALAEGLFKRICQKNGEVWSEQAEAEWLQMLRDEYEDDFDEELGLIVSTGTNTLLREASIDASATLGPGDCTVVELLGGAEPRSWQDGEPIHVGPTPWDSSGEVPYETQAEELDDWLVVLLWSALDSIRARGEVLSLGADFGRTKNLSTLLLVGQDRLGFLRLRLAVEMENMPHALQDRVCNAVLDGVRGKLKHGQSDGQGLGSASAENIQMRSRGAVKKTTITAKWHEGAWAKVNTVLEAQTLKLAMHYKLMLDDLRSLRRGPGGKAILPQRPTQEPRRQLRHADGAVALALALQGFGGSVTAAAGRSSDDGAFRIIRPGRRRGRR